MKRISEIWWCCVDPNGVTLWPFLQLRPSDLREIMNRDLPNWQIRGFRMAKLRVEEIPQRRRL